MSRQPYACGLDAAVDVMGGKWKARILWRLSEGTRRFGELRRDIPGISEKMLIQQLREMEAHGLVRREIHRQVPPKVEYSLTGFGASLNAALEPLGEWGHAHMERIAAAQESLEQERARPRGARP
ncbi:transcriptional regulator [Sphaerisporangium krabiense]|uniref:DNA-binding HxlR family transcriptional regulator n=1 Tax=Sphaerisporangium krabiense TaxID=763782 RepID=A0A7W8ZCA6_9ACTN|nr:helix-turn-helix domain-containing protein [Sphaerisporangium krabiense]MBB5631271.1 DNA-binding HxlR family transcriptional regulator [Sphaerisporangium krabiense]GII61116.1 transcriptional regulator [Sphaerisporangium krabiense]